jgi:purine-cytosine permease-like protein
MFSSNNQYVMISAVLLGLAFIIASLYFVNRMFANDTQEILVRFILLVFTALVGVYIVDKIIAFKINLLSEEQDAQLFDLIKTLVLMIFSYYFGSKKGIENKN